MYWLYLFYLLNFPSLVSTLTSKLVADRYETVLSGKLDEYRKFLGRQIELGWVDARKIEIEIPCAFSSLDFGDNLQCNQDDPCRLILSAKTYNESLQPMKRRMQDAVLEFMGVMDAFKIDVEICKSSETTTLDFSFMRSPCRRFPIQELSDSKFLRQWAYQRSRMEGPNCFHSSLAVLDERFANPRFVSEVEFKSHLARSFKIVHEPKFGDIAVLFSGEGIEHAASFVGIDDENEMIVFTKNGKADGYYLFMRLKDLMMHPFAYEGTWAQFYTIRKKEN